MNLAAEGDILDEKGSGRRMIHSSLVPATDLALQPENARKADALVDFVEGSRLEENAEMDNALAAYQKVLNFDPGQVELALRVAALLSRQEDFPRAIDVLKDAIKARPKSRRLTCNFPSSTRSISRRRNRP